MTAYLALVRKSRGRYRLELPDIPGCAGVGKTLDEARLSARDALAESLRIRAQKGLLIPQPSPLEDVLARPDADGAAAILIEVPPPARKVKTVPVTLTLPADLHEMAKAMAPKLGMSVSSMAAAGLRQFLQLTPPQTAEWTERIARYSAAAMLKAQKAKLAGRRRDPRAAKSDADEGEP